MCVKALPPCSLPRWPGQLETAEGTRSKKTRMNVDNGLNCSTMNIHVASYDNKESAAENLTSCSNATERSKAGRGSQEKQSANCINAKRNLSVWSLKAERIQAQLTVLSSLYGP